MYQKAPKCNVLLIFISLYFLFLLPFVAINLPIFASLFPYLCWELETRLTKGLSRSMFKVMVKRLGVGNCGFMWINSFAHILVSSEFHRGELFYVCYLKSYV